MTAQYKKDFRENDGARWQLTRSELAICTVCANIYDKTTQHQTNIKDLPPPPYPPTHTHTSDQTNAVVILDLLTSRWSLLLPRELRPAARLGHLWVALLYAHHALLRDVCLWVWRHVGRYPARLVQKRALCRGPPQRTRQRGVVDAGCGGVECACGRRSQSVEVAGGTEAVPRSDDQRMMVTVGKFWTNGMEKKTKSELGLRVCFFFYEGLTTTNVGHQPKVPRCHSQKSSR